jgi:hypothetical protein
MDREKFFITRKKRARGHENYRILNRRKDSTATRRETIQTKLTGDSSTIESRGSYESRLESRLYLSKQTLAKECWIDRGR